MPAVEQCRLTNDMPPRAAQRSVVCKVCCPFTNLPGNCCKAALQAHSEVNDCPTARGLHHSQCAPQLTDDHANHVAWPRI